jgi:hypothetical protein
MALVPILALGALAALGVAALSSTSKKEDSGPPGTIAPSNPKDVFVLIGVWGTAAQIAGVIGPNDKAADIIKVMTSKGAKVEADNKGPYIYTTTGPTSPYTDQITYYKNRNSGNEPDTVFAINGNGAIVYADSKRTISPGHYLENYGSPATANFTIL